MITVNMIITIITIFMTVNRYDDYDTDSDDNNNNSESRF